MASEDDMRTFEQLITAFFVVLRADGFATASQTGYAHRAQAVLTQGLNIPLGATIGGQRPRTDLDTLLAGYLDKIAPSTAIAAKSAWRLFTEFAAGEGVGFLPALPDVTSNVVTLPKRAPRPVGRPRLPRLSPHEFPLVDQVNILADLFSGDAQALCDLTWGQLVKLGPHRKIVIWAARDVRTWGFDDCQPLMEDFVLLAKPCPYNPELRQPMQARVLEPILEVAQKFHYLTLDPTSPGYYTRVIVSHNGVPCTRYERDLAEGVGLARRPKFVVFDEHMKEEVDPATGKVRGVDRNPLFTVRQQEAIRACGWRIPLDLPFFFESDERVDRRGELTPYGVRMNRIRTRLEGHVTTIVEVAKDLRLAPEFTEEGAPEFIHVLTPKGAVPKLPEPPAPENAKSDDRAWSSPLVIPKGTHNAN